MIVTGGTIAMYDTPKGLALDPGFGEIIEQRVTDICARLGATGRVNHLQPQIDSADADAETAPRIARAVRARARAGNFTGIVVLHGTDTLAHTAARLAYDLAGLGTPVVITGSQHPHGAPGTDAWDNLTLALRAALRAAPHAPVCVAFGGKLLPAIRTTKADTSALTAFRAERQLAPAPALLNAETPLFSSPKLPGITRELEPRKTPARVIALRLTPGITGAELSAFAACGCDGLILECYGAGTAPTGRSDFLAALKETTAKLPVVAITQCATGELGINRYATGSALITAGVIPGSDLTLEAALAKLAFLLDAGCNTDEIAALIPQNLVGDCHQQ